MLRLTLSFFFSAYVPRFFQRKIQTHRKRELGALIDCAARASSSKDYHWDYRHIAMHRAVFRAA